MSIRSKCQKIGARGHKWLMSHIEENADWLARDLGEDFGVDIEAELTERDLRGEILKIQIKTAMHIARQNGKLEFTIERRYLKYADSCRYPVILIFVELATKQAWYLWLQDWLLRFRSAEGLDINQKTFTHWVPEEYTVQAGLNGELKNIARWQGETQFVLSLIDALRCAASTADGATLENLCALIAAKEPNMGDATLGAVIDQAISLGDKLYGTHEGNAVANQLFAFARRCGGRITREAVRRLVLRGDAYSRVGVTSLGILYDDFFDHMKRLKLPSFFEYLEPRVAYYCAFREAFPEHHSSNFCIDPRDFIFAGLKYLKPDSHADKYANRGPSALLDYLVSVK